MTGHIAAAFVLAVAAATATAAQTSWSPPRTPDGRPDLQGIWYFGSATPLERPKEFADKPFLTAAEAAAFERREADRIARTRTVHAPEWLDYGARVGADLRSSLIVDPPDGRVPPQTPEGRQKSATRSAGRRGLEGPEDLSPGERCLVFSAGPPVVPGPYNNHLQIVQTRDHVVLHTEMIHDARVVPLTAAPPVPDHLRFWLGTSRGRWDGDTLVVETTNFTTETSFRGSDEHLKVIERFSLAGPDALRYEFTIDNPTAFTRPWTAVYTMPRTSDRMYEFACHEGNYGLVGMLRGARYEEQQSAAPR
jgi:hypothetical protein